MRQYAEESALCEYYLNDITVFNDPDDDEYEEDDDESEYYLGEIKDGYWIYKGAAQGNSETFLRLYYDTSRIDVIKILAFTLTYSKEKRKLERRIHGR